MKKLRYYFLVLNCLEQHPFPTREELMHYLAKHNSEVSERTFYRLLGELETEFDIRITMDNIGKGYVITKESIDASKFLMNCIRNFSVIDSLEEMDTEESFIIDYIDSDREVKFIPIELFQLVYKAIVEQIKLSFSVKCPLGEPVEKVVAAPLFFKQLSNQWFLITRRGKELEAFNLALLQEVALTRFRFKENIKKIQKSYQHIIGLNYTNEKAQRIKLSLDRKHKEVLHEISAQVMCKIELCDSTDRILVDFSARINDDLKKLIMSLGAGVQVLEPIALRQEIIAEYRACIAANLMEE